MKSLNQSRVDKWLWCARFFRTRTKATRYVNSRNLRINSKRVKKANSLIKLDDVLTFSLGSRVRIIKIVSITDRRGPVKDALALYNDMSPRSDSRDRNKERILVQGIRETGTGRPTKRQRRQIERLRDSARD
ncbi:MAG: RNA-binding protein S4 [Magnetovibrio sp.]|nr:RNA-binding protein S4 [Magnetovibrio sp.]